MEHKLKRERIIKSTKDVADLIRLVEKFGLRVIKIGRGTEYKTINQFKAQNSFYGLEDAIIIELKETKLEITTCYLEGKACTYIFNLNNEETFASSGLRCFTEFSKAFKLPKASTYGQKELNNWYNEEKGNYVCSASPIIGFNPRYENTVIEDCWEYDLNSAYSSAMIDTMPDLYHPRWEMDQKVKPGYIGFYIDDRLTMVEPGLYADVTFPIIPTPEKLKEYIKKWYNIKSTSSGIAKQEAKAHLNLPIGYTQRYNPFLRSYIVHKCNSQIIELIDEDSLFWNTDAIYSKKRRTDLEIGNKIGQFKEIHYKKVRYIGNVYQLDDELPVYRGIPKAWFKRFNEIYGRPFDILKDGIPEAANLYEWDWETLTLRRNYD